MVKALAAAVALALLAPGFAAAQPGRAGGALDDVLRDHVRAVQTRDLALLERTITTGEQLELIFPDGRRSTTRAEYLAFHREWFAERGWTMTIRPVSRVERAELAVVTARTRYEEREGRRLTGWNENWLTLTFAKEAGGWRLVHDQNTRIRAGAPLRSPDG